MQLLGLASLKSVGQIGRLVTQAVFEALILRQNFFLVFTLEDFD